MQLISHLRVDARAASQIISNKQIQFCDFSDNRMEGVDFPDIKKEVSRQIERYKLDTLFTHHHGDLNIDHRQVCEVVLTACHPVENRFVKRIYAF